MHCNSFFVKLPFDSALSKNRRYEFFSSKKKSDEHLKAQNDLHWLIKTALCDIDISKICKKQKIKVEIMWFRKTMQGDVQNYINPICDVIKKCIKIDDSWFCVNADWMHERNFEYSYFIITVKWNL